MEGLFPFPVPAIGLDPILFLILASTILAAVLLMAWIRTRGRSSPDIVGFIIDETDNTISRISFVKISDRVFASIDANFPMFLVIPHGTKVYQCRHGKTTTPCVMAYARGLLALPLDPSLTSAVSHLFNTEDLEKIRDEDTVKVLRALYEMEEKKIGEIRIMAPMTVAFAFDVQRILSDIINRVFGAASEAVIHFFRSARNIEALERYLSALSGYAASRFAWLQYVAIILVAAGIAAIMVLQFMPK